MRNFATLTRTLTITDALLSPPRSGPVFCDTCEQQMVDCRCDPTRAVKRLYAELVTVIEGGVL